MYDEILTELRAIRVQMDKIAAHLEGRKAIAELLPTYRCGHQHASRGEAVACERKAAAD